MPAAVEKCRHHILGYNPLCIVITRLDRPCIDHVLLGINQLHQLRGHQRRRLPIIVINVSGYNIMSGQGNYDAGASVIMHLKTRPDLQKLQSSGAAVLDWNPRKEKLGTALLKLPKV
jgi:hypothetical protein